MISLVQIEEPEMISDARAEMSGRQTIGAARVSGYELGSASKSLAGPIVFVVDDDVAVRKSLDLLIRDQGWESETFASAQLFMNRPRPLVPSCLVLDVSFPGFRGLELQKRIAVERANTPIICISSQGNVATTVQAMKAGALELLTKPLHDEMIRCAIQEALERSRSSLGQAAQLQALKERYASLSSREQQVMTLVVAGLLNKQIGKYLNISEITVKVHRGNAMRKMNANSLAHLVRMAMSLRVDR